MVHNGIEYGMMAAFAEGFNILKHANIGKQEHATDAETAPMRDPQYYQFDIDVPQVAELWRRGSVVGSWLLDLTAKALVADPQLPRSAAACPTPARAAGPSRPPSTRACPRRCSAPRCTTASRRAARATFANQILSAMRAEFGGHAEKKA